MTDSTGEITLTVNGDAHTLPAPMSVEDLLVHFDVDARQVGVERNRELVPRERFPDTKLQSGDQLEIVTFVGGG